MITSAHTNRSSRTGLKALGALVAATVTMSVFSAVAPTASAAVTVAPKGLAFPSSIVRGTSGNDLMVGSQSKLERSIGGAGSDVMLTGGTTGILLGTHPAGGPYLPYQVDALHGGAHNDVLIGPGSGIYDCGAGPNDVVMYDQMSWRNDLGGFGVMSGNASDCEFGINYEGLYSDINGPISRTASATGGQHVRDSDSQDNITGTQRADVIMTSKGGSTAANGYERVSAGAGNDIVILMGSKTQVACGPGYDTVISRNGAHKVTFNNGVVGSGIYADCERVVALSPDMATATLLRG